MINKSTLRRTTVVVTVWLVVSAMVVAGVTVTFAGAQPATAIQDSTDPGTTQLGHIPTVNVNDTRVVPGQTGTLNLTVDQLPDGLSGYTILLNLTNGSAANVTGASFPATFDGSDSLTNATVGPNNDSIRLKAADLDNRVQPGATNVSLATVDVAGVNIGETNVTIDVVRFDNESGDPIGPNTDNGSVLVATGPALSIDVDVPPEQRIRDGVTANVTVRNNNDIVPQNPVEVTVRASPVNYQYRASTTVSFTVDLGANDVAHRTVNITDWVITELNPDEFYYAYAAGRINLNGTVDPENNVTETNERDNIATNQTVATFANLAVYVGSPYSGLVDESQSIDVFVTNRGTAATTQNRTVTVTFGDGASTTLQVEPLRAGQYRNFVTSHTYTSTGRYDVTATVDNDQPVTRDNSDTDDIRIEDFTLDDVYVSTPYQVRNGSTFRIWVSYDTNAATEVNLTVELPNGLAFENGEHTIKATDQSSSWGGWESFEVTATESSADPYQINASASAQDERANGSGLVRVIVPQVRVTNETSATFSSNGTKNRTIPVIPDENVTTFEHNFTIKIQAGAQGRTLQGLEYLVNYPYGCVEQTTSPMLAALYTDQYYNDPNRTKPASFGPEDQQKINDSIEIGMDRLSAAGDSQDNAQHDNGAWSMWGNDPSGDLFYTLYAYFGTSAVKNYPRQADKPDVAESINAIDYNETVFWLRDQQDSDGSIDSAGYFLETEASTTGYTLITLDKAGPFNTSAEREVRNISTDAARYLIEHQQADGSWNDNAKTTGIVVWGLKASLDEIHAKNSTLANQTVDAIENGSQWLITDQQPSGKWVESRSSYWSSTGTTSTATAYALLALNKSAECGVDCQVLLDEPITESGTVIAGLSADNGTILNGSRYLVGVYESGGSWGYTRASAIAINALQTVGQGLGTVDRTVTVTIHDDDGPITKTATLNADGEVANIQLTASERQDLRTGDPQKRVEIDVGDGNGTVVVAVTNTQLVNEQEYRSFLNTQTTGSFQRQLEQDSRGLTTMSHKDADSSAPFHVSLNVTEDFSAGDNQTLLVTVNNTADANLTSPLIELPLTGSFDAARPLNGSVILDSGTESRDTSIEDSSFTSGQSVVLGGREVPANSERTYAIRVNITSPGDVTFEVNVRPMYNESMDVTVNDTFTAEGIGTFNVEVIDATGTTVSGAGIQLDGETIGQGTVSTEVVAGEYTIATDATDFEFPALNASVDAFETANVTFIEPPAGFADPQVVARTAEGISVKSGTINRSTGTIAKTNNAEFAALRFNVSAPVGTNNTVAIAVNETVSTEHQGGEYWDVSVTNGELIEDQPGQGANVSTIELRTNGTASVTIRYEGTTCVADSISGADEAISFNEILRGIRLWAQGKAVPHTDGQTLSFNDVLNYIKRWARGETASCSA